MQSSNTAEHSCKDSIDAPRAAVTAWTDLDSYSSETFEHRFSQVQDSPVGQRPKEMRFIGFRALQVEGLLQPVWQQQCGMNPFQVHTAL